MGRAGLRRERRPARGCVSAPAPFVPYRRRPPASRTTATLTSSTRTAPPEGPTARGLAALTALALLLRGVQARGASLWLDELHTWHHATAPSVGALLDGLRADNHPPLSFLLVRASRALFGGSELALRLPSVLCGAACVVVAARIARFLPSPRARTLAPLLVAVSSLHVAASGEARMYAPYALLCALALLGALRLVARGERRGAWILAGSLALAFHTHYHAVYVAALLFGAVLALGRARCARALAVPSLVALAACVPWAVWGLAPQLRHELAPGGSEVGLARFVQTSAQLLFHDASLAGPLANAMRAAGLISLALAAFGTIALFRRCGEARSGAVLCAALALGLPIVSAASAIFAPRAGFHWMYLAPCVVPFAVLVAAEIAAPGQAGPAARTRPLAALRRGATVLVAALACLLGGLHLGAPAREERREAAEYVLAEARDGDAVVAADWQPELFPQGLGWTYYAERLTTRPADVPPALAVGAHLSLADPGALDGVPRVFAIARSLPNDAALFTQLRAAFPRETVVPFGDAIFVHRFER